MLSNNPKLNELVKEALDKFDKLSAAEKAAHRREQAISWAYGQTVMSHFEHGKPDLTPEEEEKLRASIADIYDRRVLDKKDLSEE